MTEEKSQAIVPNFTFSNRLEEQEIQLKSNSLIQRFRQSRKQISEDPYRPIYHFVSPENIMNDPNGLCFWRGQWHLFYQTFLPENQCFHWGHAVSHDLIHWRDLPLAIAPGPEHDCYSGSTLVEKDRVIACYHGTRAGTMVAISSDPLLLNWEKVTGGPVVRMAAGNTEKDRWSAPDGSPLPYRVHDPCIWKKDGQYYSLSNGTLKGTGGKQFRANYLFRSTDLASWEYLHPFVEEDRFTLAGDDGGCPYFWPIGDRHILIFFSHMSGGQYLLGDYDTRRDKFVATAHGKFNFGAAHPSGIHAPSATPGDRGDVIVLFNMNVGKSAVGWNQNPSKGQLMTLPRRLTLGGREDIEITPAGNIESLRGEHEVVYSKNLPANSEVVLNNIEGNSLEIEAEIAINGAQVLEMNVLRSPDCQEYTRIAFFKNRGMTHSQRFYPPFREYSLVSIDSSRSSLSPDVVCRGPETAQVLLADDEHLKLRVFVDRSVVEVFINGKQVLAVRVYPSREDSVGVSLRAQGSDSEVILLNAWQMDNIYY